ncbi:MAG TPA: hypothetical protein PKE45_00115 [Caldilineaceae bacterium]|nr:hypothetical protein [Caldilineaceae bacterium]
MQIVQRKGPTPFLVGRQGAATGASGRRPRCRADERAKLSGGR